MRIGASDGQSREAMLHTRKAPGLPAPLSLPQQILPPLLTVDRWISREGQVRNRQHLPMWSITEPQNIPKASTSALDGCRECVSGPTERLGWQTYGSADALIGTENPRIARFERRGNASPGGVIVWNRIRLTRRLHASGQSTPKWPRTRYSPPRPFSFFFPAFEKRTRRTDSELR